MASIVNFLREFVEFVKLLPPLDHEEEQTIIRNIRMGPSGPDAESIRNLFYRKAIIYIGKKATPKTTSEVVARIRKDLITFICVFLEYGNNVQKALNHNSKVNMMLRCYGIPIIRRHSGQRLRDDQLSLSRIALSFPILTATVILARKKTGVVTFSLFFYQDLPLLMQHTVFPCLIPANQFTDLKEIALILNIEKSVTLARCTDIAKIRETVEEMIQASVKYIDAAINNDVDDEKKLEVLQKAGILDVDADGKLVLAASTLALVNKLPGIKANVYSLKYSDAVVKIMNIAEGEINSDSD